MKEKKRSAAVTTPSDYSVVNYFSTAIPLLAHCFFLVWRSRSVPGAIATG